MTTNITNKTPYQLEEGDVILLGPADNPTRVTVSHYDGLSRKVHGWSKSRCWSGGKRKWVVVDTPTKIKAPDGTVFTVEVA